MSDQHSAALIMQRNLILGCMAFTVACETKLRSISAAELPTRYARTRVLANGPART